jgi:hypothetical protein
VKFREKPLGISVFRHFRMSVLSLFHDAIASQLDLPYCKLFEFFNRVPLANKSVRRCVCERERETRVNVPFQGCIGLSFQMSDP